MGTINTQLSLLKRMGWELSQQYGLKPVYDGFVKPHNKRFIYPYTTQRLLAGKPKKQLFVVLSTKGANVNYYNTLFQIYGLPEARILEKDGLSYLFWLVGYRYDKKFLRFIFIDDNHMRNRITIDRFKNLVRELVYIHFLDDTITVSNKIPIVYELENTSTLDLFTMQKYTAALTALLKDDISYRTDYVLRTICSIVNALGQGKIELPNLFDYLLQNSKIFMSFYSLKRYIAFLNKFFNGARFYISNNYFYFETNHLLSIPTLAGFRKTKSGIDNSWRLYSDWINSWGKTEFIPTLVDGYTERDVFWALKQLLTKEKKWLVSPKEIMEVQP